MNERTHSRTHARTHHAPTHAVNCKMQHRTCPLRTQQKNEGAGAQVTKQMNERRNKQTNKRTNVQTYKRTNVQTYKRTNEHKNYLSLSFFSFFLSFFLFLSFLLSLSLEQIKHFFRYILWIHHSQMDSILSCGQRGPGFNSSRQQTFF